MLLGLSYCAFAQKGTPEIALHQDFRSFQLYPTGEPQRLAAIPLGEAHVLQLAFDDLSANTQALNYTWVHCEERAFVVTGQYDGVFPFDIYPNQLLKSVWAKDLEKMEALGIYEVVPEDFALCEVICTSKQPLQQMVREALDILHTEMN